MTAWWVFWAIAAAMTAGSLLVLLRPLLARRAGEPAAAAEHDLAVYRDQLAEVERDVARGLLDVAEAAAARLEIERRILATPMPATDLNPRRMRLLWPASILFVLAAAAGPLYLQVGAPGVPAQPFAGRPAPHADLAGAAEALAMRLAGDPADREGWVMLGRTYAVLGRAADSASAFREAIARGADRPEVHAGLAESILAVLPPGQPLPQDFLAAVERLRALDPEHPLGLYFAGMIAAADGDKAGAAALWRRVLDKMPAEAPQRADLERQIEALDGG